MANNLFSIAKKVAVKSTAKAKDEKIRVDAGDPEFYNMISDMSDLQKIIKSSQAKLDVISDEVRTISKKKWCETFTNAGRNPGSIMVESRNGENTAQVMVIVSDKYITIGEERAGELVEKYGEDIVEETTNFSFDNAMIEKYGEVLSNLIEGSDEISEADKGRIIKAVTKYNVSKGTIDKLDNYGNVNEVMTEVRPVVMLKGAEVV